MSTDVKPLPDEKEDDTDLVQLLERMWEKLDRIENMLHAKRPRPKK